MKTVVALVIALVALQAGATVTGVVTDEKTKSPIAAASVLLVPNDGALSASVVAATDDRGRFAFKSVTPGTYRVFAQDAGYVRREASAPVVVGAAAPREIAIVLTPMGVITGRVVDQNGVPASRVFVRAVSNGETSTARTNDLGEYRLFDLPPGAYIVSAERYSPPSVQGTFYVTPTAPCPDCPGEGQGRQGLPGLLASGNFIDPIALGHDTYPPVFYPDARDAASARPVEVAAGAEVSGIDFRLQVRKPGG
jgi:hypothetical protein